MNPKIAFGPRPNGSPIRLNQCGGCRELFGGLTAFEKHRQGLACLAPDLVGLVVSRHLHGLPVWSVQMGRAWGSARVISGDLAPDGSMDHPAFEALESAITAAGQP